jgi:asparagine synthase (glutamine-hydrolysing)
MALIDILTYLPDDILTKVDRSAMAVSLETRIPFLDHRIIEFAFTLAPHLKANGKERKWILREVLHKYLDPSLFGNKKLF